MEKSCKKFLREILAGKSCGKILLEILAGKSCGTGWNGKSQFKKDSDWWKFSIRNRVMGSQPIRIQLRNSCEKILQEILVGKSCGKFLRENLAGNAAENLVRNSAGNSVGNAVGHSPYRFQAVFEGNFQNIQFILIYLIFTCKS